MHAKVVISEDGRTVFLGETWRTDEVVRWRQHALRSTIEAEVKGGVLRSMTTGDDKGAESGSILIALPERRVVEIDAFECALIQLPVYIYTQPSLPVAPIPAAGGSGPKTVQSEGRTYQVWFDPKHSGRVVKVDFRFNEHHFVTSVVKWQTVDGVELPAELSQEGWFGGSKTSTRQIKLSEVHFGAGAPKPPALSRPKRGALVMDERRKVIYLIDENWKRISEEKPVSNGDIGGGGVLL